MDYDNLPDPDDPEYVESLREQLEDEEQVEQALKHLRFLHEMSPEQREEHERQTRDTSMGMALPPRLATASQILDIDKVAQALGLNRQLSDELLAQLDPEGTNLLKPFMLHRFAQGEPVKAHMRCQVWLRRRGKTVEEDAETFTQNMVMQDVPMDMFLALPEAQGEDWQDKLIEDIWRVLGNG